MAQNCAYQRALRETQRERKKMKRAPCRSHGVQCCNLLLVAWHLAGSIVLSGSTNADEQLRSKIVSLWENGRTRCLGTVISPTTVLTAAQCFVDPTVNYRTYLVLPTSTESDESESPIGIERIYVHPGFNRVNLHNDIAVLQVNSTLDFAIPASIADMDSSCFDDSMVVAQLVWNDSSQEVAPGVAKVNFSLVDCVDQKHCEEDSANEIVVNDTIMFCTEIDASRFALPPIPGEKSVTGGPLFVASVEDWLLLGVVSSDVYGVSAEVVGHNGPQILRANTRASAFTSFVASVHSALEGTSSTQPRVVGWPTDCVDCAGMPCGHYVETSVGDGACDDGAWGPNFFCEAFSFDGGDCAFYNPDLSCLDCDGGVLDCRSASTVHSPSSVLRMYELMLGDGICQSANTSGSPRLNCSRFQFEHGDCLPTIRTPTIGVDGMTGRCLDCSPNGIQCTQSTVWLGDGFCDGGSGGVFGIDFNCSAFAFDAGDCVAASLTTTTMITSSVKVTHSSSGRISTLPDIHTTLTEEQLSTSTVETEMLPDSAATAEQQRVVIVSSVATAVAVLVVVAVVVGFVLWKKGLQAKATEKPVLQHPVRSHHAVANSSKQDPGPVQFAGKAGTGHRCAQGAQGGAPSPLADTPATPRKIEAGQALVSFWKCAVCTHMNKVRD